MSGLDEHGNSTLDFQEFVEWYRDAGPKLALLPMRDQKHDGVELTGSYALHEHCDQEPPCSAHKEEEEEEEEEEDFPFISQAFQVEEGNSGDSDDEEEDMRGWDESDDKVDKECFSEEDSQDGEAGSRSSTPELPAVAENNEVWDASLNQLNERTDQSALVKILL